MATKPLRPFEIPRADRCRYCKGQSIEWKIGVCPDCYNTGLRTVAIPDEKVTPIQARKNEVLRLVRQSEAMVAKCYREAARLKMHDVLTYPEIINRAWDREVWLASLEEGEER